MQARLEEQIGDDIFGVDDATLEDVVWKHLRESNSTIHVTEAGLPGVISDAWNADSDRLRRQNAITTTRYRSLITLMSNRRTYR